MTAEHEPLIMWTVYDHPRDRPDKIVARAHRITTGRSIPTDQVLEGDSLDEVRSQLPAGLFNLGRHPNDDPKIVESWI